MKMFIRDIHGGFDGISIESIFNFEKSKVSESKTLKSVPTHLFKKR